MGKRLIVERQTSVREAPDPSGLEIFLGLLFWLFILGLILKGCGG